MTTPAAIVPKVYAAINAVTAALAKEGIGKDRKNQTQGYNFRGIDDVYNALGPLLAEHKLVVLPRILSRTVVERETKNGGVMFSVTLEAEFDFISSEDGSSHTCRSFGEAMDSGDKATNKAMSAAYKYIIIMGFCIPVVGTPDADDDAHPELLMSAEKKKAEAKKEAEKPHKEPDPTPEQEGNCADYETQIRDCKTQEELAEVFGSAQKWARGTKLHILVARVIQAKDKRKSVFAGAKS